MVKTSDVEMDPLKDGSFEFAGILEDRTSHTSLRLGQGPLHFAPKLLKMKMIVYGFGG
jgi:hypothetical protein